jgi:hypothetical protein
MEPNQDILTTFQKLPEHRKLELQRMMDEYETACELSRGPQPARSKYWETRAWDLEGHLKKMLVTG